MISVASSSSTYASLVNKKFSYILRNNNSLTRARWSLRDRGERGSSSSQKGRKENYALYWTKNRLIVCFLRNKWWGLSSCPLPIWSSPKASALWAHSTEQLDARETAVQYHHFIIKAWTEKRIQHSLKIQVHGCGCIFVKNMSSQLIITKIRLFMTPICNENKEINTTFVGLYSK